MKSVLISIQPKWCEKIFRKIGTDKNGKPIYEKTIEVRKTKPSIPTPFKCYIYCCKAKSQWRYSNYEGAYENSEGKIVYAQQHVIGEFICDKVSTYPRNYKFGYEISENEFNETALTAEQFVDYGNGGTLYGWHISQLKIYDKPKELNEFYTIDESGNDCCIACVNHETPIEEMPCRTCTGERRYLYRPPQGWMYVQELEDENDK